LFDAQSIMKIRLDRLAPFAACLLAAPLSIAALLAFGASSACSKSDSTPVATVDAGVSAAFRATLANPAPANLQEGERIYYEETYGTEVDHSWPPAAFMVQLWKGDTKTWGEQFSNWGWLVDPGDDLPVGLKRGSTDPTLVHEVCATCHVTKLDDGRIWSGMPALHLDWAGFRLAINTAWVAAGNPPIETDKSIAKLQGILQPGSSNADSTDDPHIVPADFPLYVDLGPRKNLGYIGSGKDVRSQAFLSILTFGAGDDPNIPFPTDAISGPLVDYLSWTVAPTPLSANVDAAAAARGATVFQNEKCGSCHHDDDLGSNIVAEWNNTIPELVPGTDPAHPEGTIATDVNFFNLSNGPSDGGAGPGPGLQSLLKFIVANNLKVDGTDGYAVTDLHGLFVMDTLSTRQKTA
jgi:mono/diheme cytochrome c family protein